MASTNLVLILPQSCPSDLWEAVRGRRSVWGIIGVGPKVRSLMGNPNELSGQPNTLAVDIRRVTTHPVHNTLEKLGTPGQIES